MVPRSASIVRSGVISSGSSACDQLVALGGGQVGHLRRVVDQPGEVVVGELLGAEPRQAQLLEPLDAFVEGEVGEVPRRLLAAARFVEDEGQGGAL